MRTAKKKKPAPKLQQDWDEPKPKKPEIPKELVDKFLEDKITPKDRKKVSQIKCTNLWDNRYRINVWLEETQEEQVEKLEQLRWLKNGWQIGCLSVQYNGVEINSPEDVEEWHSKHFQ